MRITSNASGDWRAATQLLPYLWRHRWRVALALGFLILGRAANVTVPLALKEIVDQLQGSAQTVVVVPVALLAAYGLLRFSAILFNELRNVIFIRVGLRIIRDISLKVFAHLHTLSLRFHLDRKTGGLSRDMDRGNHAITNFLRIIVFNVTPVIIEIALVIVILWNQLAPIYVLITVLMIGIYSIFTFFVTRWRTQFRVQMNESDSAAGTHVLDSLLNYETVKVFGSERGEIGRYDASLDIWSAASHKNSTSLSLLNAGQGLVIALGLTILMIMAAHDVQAGVLTLGDFVMVNAFLIQLYIPLNFLGSVYRDLNHSLVDMQRLFDLLDEPAEVIEAVDAKPLVFSRGEVRFENVSFSFNEDRQILYDISFTIPGGGTLAVVGPSGSGKSTLARLLLRFYDPTHGCIYIDNQPVGEVTLKSLRARMGVVPQDTVLFNDTIGYNIGYGRADCTKQDIEDAAKVAQIHEFITRHPQGYDILVGERGLKLSGGEKQRVAIARVALKRANILIFDEATSSLDSRSEKAIQEALDRVSKSGTTLVIAHRLSTVVNADEIIVLDDGKIVERGNHSTLVAADRLYAQMWALQKQA